MTDSYLKDPRTMTDEELASWSESFKDQPPTMDYMNEFIWAGEIMYEIRKREESR